MRFLKENRTLLFVFLVLPLFFFYLDGALMSQLKAVNENSPHFRFVFESIDPVMSFLSHGLTLLVAACVIYAIGRYYSERLRALGISLVLGFAASGVSAQVIKHLIGRARPRVTDQFVVVGPTFQSGYDSFPSGHSAVAFCFSYILSRYFPRYRFFFYLFAVATAFVRVEKTSHFASDVIAGALVGIIAAKLLLNALSRKGIAPKGMKAAPAAE
jgi:membrane-associated phospholipid phosphatase